MLRLRHGFVAADEIFEETKAERTKRLAEEELDNICRNPQIFENQDASQAWGKRFPRAWDQSL